VGPFGTYSGTPFGGQTGVSTRKLAMGGVGELRICNCSVGATVYSPATPFRGTLVNVTGDVYAGKLCLCNAVSLTGAFVNVELGGLRGASFLLRESKGGGRSAKFLPPTGFRTTRFCGGDGDTGLGG
jgi:hypothetical protein